MRKELLSDKDRFKSYVDVEASTGCWLWTGGSNPKGYGRFGIKNSFGKWILHYAHRVAYEYYVGPIPDGMDVLHDCNTPRCVNPKHLHLGDDSTNKLEAYRDGLMDAVGEKNGQAVLTKKDVLEIRASDELHAILAERYGVAKSTISSIKTRRSWSHV